MHAFHPVVFVLFQSNGQIRVMKIVAIVSPAMPCVYHEGAVLRPGFASDDQVRINKKKKKQII